MRVGFSRGRFVEVCLAAAAATMSPLTPAFAEPYVQASGNQPSLAGKDYGKTVRPIGLPHVRPLALRCCFHLCATHPFHPGALPADDGCGLHEARGRVAIQGRQAGQGQDARKG